MDPDIDCTPSQTSTAVSTPIPDQNTTAVSIRDGLDASASAASILSDQLSTAASLLSGQVSSTASKTTTARIDSAASASTTFTLTGQVSTAVKNQEKKQC